MNLDVTGSETPADRSAWSSAGSADRFDPRAHGLLELLPGDGNARGIDHRVRPERAAAADAERTDPDCGANRAELLHGQASVRPLHMSVQRHESAFGTLETDVQKRVRPTARAADRIEPRTNAGWAA